LSFFLFYLYYHFAHAHRIPSVTLPQSLFVNSVAKMKIKRERIGWPARIDVNDQKAKNSGIR